MLNYIGPNNGEGIRGYINGEQVAIDTTKTPQSPLAGDGRIVIGRRFTDVDEKYASVQVDELIFFNKSLKTAEIDAIFNLM